MKNDKDLKGKGDDPSESWDSPCFLNSYWSLGAAESSLSPCLGQWFMSKGFHREIQGVA